MGPWLRVSSNRLDEPGIEFGTPGYKASGLLTKPGQLLKDFYLFYGPIEVMIVDNRCIIHKIIFSSIQNQTTKLCRKNVKLNKPVHDINIISLPTSAVY